MFDNRTVIPLKPARFIHILAQPVTLLPPVNSYDKLYIMMVQCNLFQNSDTSNIFTTETFSSPIILDSWCLKMHFHFKITQLNNIISLQCLTGHLIFLC